MERPGYQLQGVSPGRLMVFRQGLVQIVRNAKRKRETGSSVADAAG